MRSPLPFSRARRVLSLASIATVSAIGAVTIGALPASAAPGDVAIDVYTMNDFHGRIETTSSTAGAAVIAGAYRGFQTENPNSTLVSAGDNVGASTFVSLSQDDNPTIDALNATGLTVTAIGNHELDKGTVDLDEHIIERANYDHISANLLLKGTDEYAYAPYDLQTFEGVTVGFVGAVTEDLPYLVSPAGIATLDVAPIVESVNTVASALKDGDDANGEADVVILLIHEGAATATADITDTNTVFGRIVTGTAANLDAIASGHTHQAYADTYTVDGRTIPVLQTGSYGTNLGHIALEVNPTTFEITANTGELIPLLTPEGEPAFPADPTVQAIVDAAVAEAEVVGAETIGEVTDSITRAVQTDGTENRGGESALGNLVADAQLWATAELGTEIAFMNPGGIRQNIDYLASGSGDLDGEVTYEEAAVVQPFANTLVTETLTGAQIKTVLEQQWQPVGTSRPELHLGLSSGFFYTYDPTAPVGSKITSMSLNGVPIALDAGYTIVANSFLTAGGDNFTEFANGTDVADTGRIDLQSFVDYMREFSPITPSQVSHSVGLTTTTPFDATAVAPGQTLSFSLSSLTLSSDPAEDQTLIAYIGDETGTVPPDALQVPIDTTIVDTTDEQGQADVSLTVPASAAAGVYTVAFVTSNGTGTVIPINVVAAAPTAPTPTPVPTPVPTLPATGGEFGGTLGGAALLMLAGLVVVGARRMRLLQK